VTFTTSEADEDDRGEDLGGLDDLLASLRKEEEPAPPKRGRGRAKKEAPAKDFKAVLWASADKLRAQMDAAEYKHLVLGLIFLKFISDTFTAHQATVLARVSDPESDYYMGDDPADHQAALEDRDYYIGLAEFRLWAFPMRKRRISWPASPSSGDHSFTPRSCLSSPQERWMAPDSA
jgi:hypothetical protein